MAAVLTDLERDREKRIAENQRRMAEMLGNVQTDFNLLLACAPGGVGAGYGGTCCTARLVVSVIGPSGGREPPPAAPGALTRPVARRPRRAQPQRAKPKGPQRKPGPRERVAIADEDKRHSDRIRQLPAPAYNLEVADRTLRWLAGRAPRENGARSGGGGRDLDRAARQRARRECSFPVAALSP
jgi:hypothetical protein